MGDMNVGLETQAESAERNSQRPLVTFALFAYNQERYIREAIDGAFAQTYEPLEIILSDDCSTDRTYKIMQEMAAAYAGKAHIKLNRNAANLASAGHANRVIELSTGRLIVGAAGDDVSLPDRVQVLVDEWQQTRAWGLMSRCNLINEHGEFVRHDVTMDLLSDPTRAYFDHAVTLIHGATSAYDRRAFALLDPPPNQRILHEDVLLSILLNATGKPIHLVDRTLVNYRQHEGSTTNHAVKGVTATYIRDYENLASVSAKSLRNATAYCVKTCKPERHKINFAELNRRLRFYDLASVWMTSTFQQRVAIFVAGGRTERRWLAPRIFGFRVFVVTKLAAYRVKRILAAVPGRSARNTSTGN
jgi:glycosyltransferase involved in cell wall biosynthesis